MGEQPWKGGIIDRRADALKREGRRLLLAAPLFLGLPFFASYWMAGFSVEEWRIVFWMPVRILWLRAPWYGVYLLWRDFNLYTRSSNPDASIVYASICGAYALEYLVLALLAVGIGLMASRLLGERASQFGERLMWLCLATYFLLVGTGMVSIVASMIVWPRVAGG